MRDPYSARSIIHPRYGGAVQIEALDDSLESAFDLAIDVADGQVDERGGELRQERLKTQLLSERALGAAPLGALIQEPHDEGGLHDDEDGPDYDVPLVEIPGGRLAEPHHASGREPLLVDAVLREKGSARRGGQEE